MTLAAPVLSEDMDVDTATCPASRAWQDALIDADVLHHLLQSMGRSLEQKRKANPTEFSLSPKVTETQM